MSTAIGPVATVPFIGDLSEAAEYFEAAATVDPLSTLLVVVGQLILAVSILFFFYLAARGLLDLVIPDSIGRGPPQQD